jgi:hypothetical protein
LIFSIPRRASSLNSTAVSTFGTLAALVIALLIIREGLKTLEERDSKMSGFIGLGAILAILLLVVLAAAVIRGTTGPIQERPGPCDRLWSKNMVHKEVDGSFDDLSPTGLDLCVHFTPVVARILDDHCLNGRLALLRLLLHVMGMFNGNRRVLVTLDHQQGWAC